MDMNLNHRRKRSLFVMRFVTVTLFIVWVVTFSFEQVIASVVSSSSSLRDVGTTEAKASTTVGRPGRQLGRRQLTLLLSSSVVSDGMNESPSIADLHDDNNNNLNEVVAIGEVSSMTIIKTNLIVSFLEQMGSTKSLVILRWNTDGILERITPLIRPDWFRNETIYKLFYKTQPSFYGKVAFLLNDDILTWIDWNIVPPIPLMLYTIPNNKTIDVQHYKVIPNPYDRDGFNQWTIDDTLDHVKQNMTFDEFHDRKNVIIWRGTLHADMDIFRQVLIDMSGMDNNRSWLDAANTDTHPELAMSAVDMIRKYKYQIDIGGVSGTAWGGLRWKLCTGNFVFKVDTYSQDWWHDTLIPWEHYVPVKSDLSNLHELYYWAETHPQDVYDIAHRGMMECLKTHTTHAADVRTMDIIQALPEATPERIAEVDDIFDNHLDRFFQQGE